MLHQNNTRPRIQPSLTLPSPSQRGAEEEFRPLQLLVEENGDVGLQAIRNLTAAYKARRQKLSLNHLRVLLRPLITKESRRRLLPLLLPASGHTVDIKAAERESARLLKDLWTGFHWSDENPNISADVRMAPPPCLSC